MARLSTSISPPTLHPTKLSPGSRRSSDARRPATVALSTPKVRLLAHTRRKPPAVGKVRWEHIGWSTVCGLRFTTASYCLYSPRTTVFDANEPASQPIAHTKRDIWLAESYTDHLRALRLIESAKSPAQETVNVPARPRSQEPRPSEPRPSKSRNRVLPDTHVLALGHQLSAAHEGADLMRYSNGMSHCRNRQSYEARQEPAVGRKGVCCGHPT